jgi:hypothetical protein
VNWWAGTKEVNDMTKAELRDRWRNENRERYRELQRAAAKRHYWRTKNLQAAIEDAINQQETNRP